MKAGHMLQATDVPPTSLVLPLWELFVRSDTSSYKCESSKIADCTNGVFSSSHDGLRLCEHTKQAYSEKQWSSSWWHMATRTIPIVIVIVVDRVAADSSSRSIFFFLLFILLMLLLLLLHHHHHRSQPVKEISISISNVPSWPYQQPLQVVQKP